MVTVKETILRVSHALTILLAGNVNGLVGVTGALVHKHVEKVVFKKEQGNANVLKVTK